MAREREHGWTAGAPKWAAVIVLGAASVAGLAWAMGRETTPWARAHSTVASPVLASAGPTPTASAPTPDSVRPQVEPKAKKSNPPPAASVKKLININTAGQADLELLPGIGPALAKRFMDYRSTKGPFKRVEELDAVKGIGPKILERVRGMVCVE